MTFTEQINQFISENGGNERDALIIAITRLDGANRLLALKDEQIRELQEDGPEITEYQEATHYTEYITTREYEDHDLG